MTKLIPHLCYHREHCSFSPINGVSPPPLVGGTDEMQTGARRTSDATTVSSVATVVRSPSPPSQTRPFDPIRDLNPDSSQVKVNTLYGHECFKRSPSASVPDAMCKSDPWSSGQSPQNLQSRKHDHFRQPLDSWVSFPKSPEKRNALTSRCSDNCNSKLPPPRIEIVQQPEAARMSTLNGARHINPPPILRLRLDDEGSEYGRGPVAFNPDWHYYLVACSLWTDDPPSTGYSRAKASNNHHGNNSIYCSNYGGTNSRIESRSSILKAISEGTLALKEGGLEGETSLSPFIVPEPRIDCQGSVSGSYVPFYVFHQLICRMTGRFRLRFDLYRMEEPFPSANVPGPVLLDTVWTRPFECHTPRKYPGNSHISPLLLYLKAHGEEVRVSGLTEEEHHTLKRLRRARKDAVPLPAPPHPYPVTRDNHGWRGADGERFSVPAPSQSFPPSPYTPPPGAGAAASAGATATAPAATAAPAAATTGTPVAFSGHPSPGMLLARSFRAREASDRNSQL